MPDADESNNERFDEQREVLSTDWWKTVFHNVSWSYPPLQGSPACRPSKRTALLRISRANRALKSRLTKYLKLDHISATTPDELSGDLVGVKAVEEVLEPYEAGAGFSMLDSILGAMHIGRIPDATPLSNLEMVSKAHRQRWDHDVQTLGGGILRRMPDDEPAVVDLTPEEGEEMLKSLSQLWDLCLSDVSIIDHIRSADNDLTDSELSADSDPPPRTPKAGKYSLSTLSPPSIKPLSATASSFIPSPARFSSIGSSSSSSASPSPSPPVLDIINFPTLNQTIPPPARKDDQDGKSKWPSKRSTSLMPSFLAESGARKSKTRQMVDKMRSASDARKPDPDFILMVDERSGTETAYKTSGDENHGSWKANKKRTRRGRESISTVSTDNASIRSSSVEESRSKPQSLGSLAPSRSQGTRTSSKQSKRTSSLSVTSPIVVPTPPTPTFSSPAASVSSFGGPVTPGSFAMPFPPPPPPPPHHAFMHMNGRTPSYPPPFPYSYYPGIPGGGMMPPPTTFVNSYQVPYTPYNPYGKGVITGTSGIRHASW